MLIALGLGKGGLAQLPPFFSLMKLRSSGRVLGAFRSLAKKLDPMS